MSSNAVLPARMIKSAHEMDLPYFCLIGHSRRRALSRLPLSGQLLSGAKRCCPYPRNMPVSSCIEVANGKQNGSEESYAYHTTAAASILDAVGTGAVPGHTDEQTAVVTEVCRPPRL